MPPQPSNSAAPGGKLSDPAVAPDLTAKESVTVGSISDNVLRGLDKHQGVWIKGDGDLLEKFWISGSLFKRITVTEDQEGAVNDGPGGELIIAGARDGDRLLGLKVTAFAGGSSTKKEKELAKDEKLLFVIDSRAEVPDWIEEWYYHLQIPYDHPQLVGVHVDKLVSIEYSREGRYQLLQKNPTEGGICTAHWEEGMMAGKLERRRETKTFGRELLQDAVKGKKAVEMRLGKATSASHTVSAPGHGGKTKEKGPATLLGDLALGPGDESATTLAAMGPVGGKRERSETAEDDDEKEALEARKAKRAKQPAKRVVEHTKRPILNRMHLNGLNRKLNWYQIVPWGSADKAKKPVKNSMPVIPEGLSCIDAGASAQYTESEGKNAYTYQAYKKT